MSVIPPSIHIKPKKITNFNVSSVSTYEIQSNYFLTKILKSAADIENRACDVGN